MATSNTKPTTLIFPTFITFFLLLLSNVKSLSDISISFNKFQPNQRDLIFQGNATVSAAGVLQLTEVKNGVPIGWSIGRALYAAPVQIWDRSTGRVASFSTSFSFVVKALDPTKRPADGLAFFLAPPNLPLGAPAGFLGLFDNANYDASKQIIAVEFDTFVNSPFDPSFRHIGVDVNSIQSIKTVAWDPRDGEVAYVFINYLAPQKTLIVSLTYASAQETFALSATVDVKAILPEWVTVGFSGATGANNIDVQTHDIHQWYFTSTWEDNSYAGLENNVHTAHYTA